MSQNENMSFVKHVAITWRKSTDAPRKKRTWKKHGPERLSPQCADAGLHAALKKNVPATLTMLNTYVESGDPSPHVKSQALAAKTEFEDIVVQVLVCTLDDLILV